MKTLVYVDDDIDIIELATEMVDVQDVNFIATSNPDDLDQIKEIHVFISDLSMPKINGIELIKKVRKKYNCICMLFSGNVELDIELEIAEVDAQQETATKIVLKPNLAEVLAEGIRLCRL